MKTLYLEKQFYAQEIMMLTISSEEVPNSLDREVNINLYVERHFPVDFCSSHINILFIS